MTGGKRLKAFRRCRQAIFLMASSLKIKNTAAFPNALTAYTEYGQMNMI